MHATKHHGVLPPKLFMFVCFWEVAFSGKGLGFDLGAQGTRSHEAGPKPPFSEKPHTCTTRTTHETARTKMGGGFSWIFLS